MRSATAANSRPAAVTCPRESCDRTEYAELGFQPLYRPRQGGLGENAQAGSGGDEAAILDQRQDPSSWRALKSGSAELPSIASGAQHALAVSFAQESASPICRSDRPPRRAGSREAEGVAARSMKSARSRRTARACDHGDARPRSMGDAVHRLRSMNSPWAASSRTRRLASEVAKRSLTKAFWASLAWPTSSWANAQASFRSRGRRSAGACRSRCRSRGHVFRRHAADARHVGADALVGVAPEEWTSECWPRSPRLLRAAAEIEARIRLLQRVRTDCAP